MPDRLPIVKDDMLPAVERLAQKHQFHPDCALAEKLEDIAQQYKENQGLVVPSWAQRRIAVEEVNKRVSALLKALQLLDRAAGGPMVPTQLREELVELQAMTANDVAELKGKRGGGPKRNHAKHILVMRLCRLYRCWTGKADRYTAHEWSRKGPTHSGPFIDFAMEAAELLGVKLIPSFIAQTLKESNSGKKGAS